MKYLKNFEGSKYSYLEKFYSDDSYFNEVIDFIKNSNLFCEPYIDKFETIYYYTKNIKDFEGYITALRINETNGIVLQFDKRRQQSFIAISHKAIGREAKFWGGYNKVEVTRNFLYQIHLTDRYLDRHNIYIKTIDDYNKMLERTELYKKDKHSVFEKARYPNFLGFNLTDNEFEFIQNYNEVLNNSFERFLREKDEEKQRFHIFQKSLLSEFDKDGNGLLDTIEVEDEFLKLLKKHQSKIIEVDKSYIQKFVKVSDYHKTQRKNLQTIFENITKTKNEDELSRAIYLLKEQIHSYESLIFHSFNMLTSLVDDDLVTFYQIHSTFDKLNIFNSNHQNMLMNKLSNIEDGLNSLILSIRSMEQNIINELNHLSYVTESSYEKLSISVNENLKAIGSSINTNNLLTAINTYQNYSTNKRLNS